MISSIAEIIKAYKNGEMVILIDDENRENEGDLLAPASLIKPEQINFMSKYARGLICLTLTSERCDHLNLPLMVSSENNTHKTNFTLSIEAAKGVSTGISAADRAQTVLTAVNPNTTASDIISPGHIFPLRARDGGVLVRAGHTEAGCDLATLAELTEPSSVIVEIMNEDGSMARLPDLILFSQKHQIKLGTIADLIRYRLANEQLMKRVSNHKTEIYGEQFELITYFDEVDNINHYALIYGEPSEITKQDSTLVRVHVQDYLRDTLGIIDNSVTASWSLKDSCNYIIGKKSGVIVLLSSGNNGVLSEDQQIQMDQKNYGKGSQILNDLGVTKMDVLGSKKQYSSIDGFDLTVNNFIPFSKNK